MNILSQALSRIRSRSQGGFTMIELLIVIAILGILATAVLSAINPVEQINRGRDTGTRSDAEQLLSAIDRYNAFRGFYPWMIDANATSLALKSAGTTTNGTTTGANLPIQITTSTPMVVVTSSTCKMLDRLTSTPALGSTGCTKGSDELKASFVTRITSTSSRSLYIYNRGQQGDSTYVCFVPQSNAFKADAEARCGNVAAVPGTNGGAGTAASYGGGMPSDMEGDAAKEICGGGNIKTAMVCLP